MPQLLPHTGCLRLGACLRLALFSGQREPWAAYVVSSGVPKTLQIQPRFSTGQPEAVDTQHAAD